MQSLSSSLRRASRRFSASSLLRLSKVHSDVAKYRSFSGNGGIRLGFFGTRDGVFVPYVLKFQNFIHSESQKSSEAGRSSGIPDSKSESTEENNSQTSQQSGPWSGRNSRPMDFDRNVVHNDQSQPFRNFINSESQNNSQAGRFSGIPDSRSGSTEQNSSQTFQQNSPWSRRSPWPVDFDRNTIQNGRSEQFQNFTHSGSQNDSPAGRFSGISDSMSGLTEQNSSQTFQQNGGWSWPNPRPMNFERNTIQNGRSQQFQNFTHSGSQNNSQAGMVPVSDLMKRLAEKSSSPTYEQNGQSSWRNRRPMEFVRNVVQNDMSQMFRNYQVQNCDIVSIFIGRNNTKIHLTDSKGQGKAYISAGCLPEMKSGVSRYAAQATSEYMGRKARELGVKSVVVKVNGLSYFKKKRQAIMSFREGFTGSRGGYHPIVHIEDTTRLAHNGCRLKKKRRI